MCNGWRKATYALISAALIAIDRLHLTTRGEFVTLDQNKTRHAFCENPLKHPLDGDRNLIKATNTPVVRFLAIAAFDRAYQLWPRWFTQTYWPKELTDCIAFTSSLSFGQYICVNQRGHWWARSKAAMARNRTSKTYFVECHQIQTPKIRPNTWCVFKVLTHGIQWQDTFRTRSSVPFSSGSL